LIYYIVTLFPAIDAFSSFPLVALVAVENLIAIKYPHLSISERESLPFLTVLKYKIVVMIPPVILPIFLYNLGTANDWTGIVAYYILYINVILTWL
jgi:hypothetical protein